MKRVLILFCGGTIVMVPNKDGALTTQDREEAMQNLLTLEPRIHDIAEISTAFVDNIDSTNITTEHWDTIAEEIYKNYDQYDGFVITHGTNTMAYTAGALSFALQNLGKPIALTGAQIPASNIETDARRNFVNAIRVACSDVSGVFIIFDEEVIFGYRASKTSESKLDAFETINDVLAGEIRINLEFHPTCPVRTNKPVSLHKGFERQIAILTLSPYLPPETLEHLLIGGVKGIILQCFGPGDLPPTLIPYLKKAKELQVPVVITTQCREGATALHTNEVGLRASKEGGVIDAKDMSLEAITTKLMWAIAHYPFEKVKGIMECSLVGEIGMK